MPATSRTPKIRAYRDILTPALHKSFAAGTFRILLPLCCALALVIDQGASLPWTRDTRPSISTVLYFLCSFGIRTGLLFICVLSICILRVSQWHVGVRTTKSPADTFRQHFFRFETVQAALHYLASAWLFCEIYIYSAPKEANISWVVQGKIYDRLRLNERPIYLMTFFLSCAVLQTICHVLFDYDRIEISEDQSDEVASGNVEAEKTPAAKFYEGLAPNSIHCLTKTLIITAMTPVIYVPFIRQQAWKYTLMFAKIFYNLPKNSSLPNKWPFHVFVLGRCLIGGGLLFAMWSISNLAFSVYVGQPPLKKGKPITDGSNDPNGSLLNGLNSTKPLNRTFAFWELQRIAHSDEVRRQTIYTEIDRKGGPTWSQIFKVCTENIGIVNDRMTNYLKPPTSSKSDTLSNPSRDELMPRVGTPLKDDLVISPRKESPGFNLKENVGEFLRSYGESSSPYNAPQALYDQGAKLAPGLSTEAASAKNLYRSFWMYILKSPIGYLFQHTFRRRALSVILGSPHGDLSLIISAIHSLSQLAVQSIQEDPFGKVQRNIREILETFTTTVENVEAVEKKLLSEIDWTDVDFEDEDGSDVVNEIEALLKVLRASLQDLIAAFGNYSEAMTLNSRVMRKARDAAVDLRKKKKKGEQKSRSNAKTVVNVSKAPERTRSRVQRTAEREAEKQRNSTTGNEGSGGSGEENESQEPRQPEMRETAERRRRRLPPLAARRNQATVEIAPSPLESLMR